jgi:uncharacterized protein (TIGR03067 family)
VRHLLALALFVGLTTAAPVPKAVKKKADETLIVGAWKVVDDNGRTGEQRDFQTFTFPDAANMVVTDRSGVPAHWQITLDTEATPRRVRWVSTRGNTTWDCAYELSGDVLKMGILSHGVDPPAAVTKSDHVHLIEMTRDTSAK